MRIRWPEQFEVGGGHETSFRLGSSEQLAFPVQMPDLPNLAAQIRNSTTSGTFSVSRAGPRCCYPPWTGSESSNSRARRARKNSIRSLADDKFRPVNSSTSRDNGECGGARDERHV